MKNHLLAEIHASSAGNPGPSRIAIIIDSAPGEGTIVRAYFPLRETDADQSGAALSGALEAE